MQDPTDDIQFDSTSKQDVEFLGVAARSSTITSVVDAVRKFLDIDVAYVTEMTESEQRFRVLSGDGASFGVDEGTTLPVDETYCRLVLAGELPSVIPDVGLEPEAAALPISDAAGVGAFTSVPLRFSDGRLFGTMCAASHRPRPELGDRDLEFLRVFARIVSDFYEREEANDRARAIEVRATAVETLMAAVHARDSYTEEHSREVVDLAGAVSEGLGLGPAEVTDVKLTALLHDIGKIATPDAVLQKRGRLDASEQRIMRQHPEEGERLIKQSPSLEHLAPAIRGEHERWDGGGYPDGLAGKAIPLASRITLACDAFSAMTNDRPYRAAMSLAQARAELEANSGSQFDPDVVAALCAELDDRGADVLSVAEQRHSEP